MQPKHPLALIILECKILKPMDKPPKMGKYDGKGDPDEHMYLVNDWINYFSIDDTSSCKLFALTLIELTRLWFNGLPDDSITS